ncbi:MAG: hypothetical protein HOO99_11090, partial [Hyphomicrobiaceae bacterium]|nr:hypothetical protein [Hyphomicrobiaceae bacterium]
MVQSSPIDPPLGAPSVWRQLGIGRLLALGIFLAAFSLLLLALLAHLLPPGRVAATADIVTPLTLHAIATG